MSWTKTTTLTETAPETRRVVFYRDGSGAVIFAINEINADVLVSTALTAAERTQLQTLITKLVRAAMAAAGWTEVP